MDEEPKMTNYRIEYWHTDHKIWMHYGNAYDLMEAKAMYHKALAWHYAGIVRLVKVAEEVLKQSKEP